MKGAGAPLTLIYGLVLGLFVVLFRFFISPGVPNSRFYQPDAKSIQRRAAMYQSTGLKALEQYRQFVKGRRVFANEEAKDLCIGIVSVARPKYTYLEQTVAALLTRLPLRYEDRIRITLYNADSPPSKHRVARDLSELLQVKNISYLDVDPNLRVVTRKNIKRKEFLDYIGVLRDEASNGCKNYLVLEDDVVPCRDWIEKVYELLAEMEHSRKGDDIALVKLFSMVAFGRVPWDPRNVNDVCSVLALAALFTMAVMASVWMVWRRQRPNKRSVAFLFIGMLCFVIWIEKIHFMREGRGFHVRDPGASYQAVLYSHDALLRWDRFFTDTYFDLAPKWQLQPKDVYVSAFCRQQARDTGRACRPMVMVPNLFQHIGVSSSVGNGASVGRAMFSASFEDDDLPITFDEQYIQS